jgi:hypothetical protein
MRSEDTLSEASMQTRVIDCYGDKPVYMYVELSSQLRAQ